MSPNRILAGASALFALAAFTTYLMGTAVGGDWRLASFPLLAVAVLLLAVVNLNRP